MAAGSANSSEGTGHFHSGKTGEAAEAAVTQESNPPQHFSSAFSLIPFPLLTNLFPRRFQAHLLSDLVRRRQSVSECPSGFSSEAQPSPDVWSDLPCSADAAVSCKMEMCPLLPASLTACLPACLPAAMSRDLPGTSSLCLSCGPVAGNQFR